MRVKSATEFRKTLSATLDQVNADHTPVIITREGGKPAAVVLSYEDYLALDETAYLMRSPKNAERLMRSIAEIEAGGGIARELVDPDAPPRAKPAA